jgi:hypothetical protein
MAHKKGPPGIQRQRAEERNYALQRAAGGYRAGFPAVRVKVVVASSVH